MSGAPPSPAWTVEQVRALGTRTDLVTACKIVYGCGKNKAWEMYHAGELPFPTLPRCGRRVFVAVATVQAALSLNDSEAT
jgi:hypothetical protein